MFFSGPRSHTADVAIVCKWAFWRRGFQECYFFKDLIARSQLNCGCELSLFQDMDCFFYFFRGSCHVLPIQRSFENELFIRREYFSGLPHVLPVKRLSGNEMFHSFKAWSVFPRPRHVVPLERWVWNELFEGAECIFMDLVTRCPLSSGFKFF